MVSIERRPPHDPPHDPPGYPHKKAKLSNAHDSSPRLLSLRNSTEEQQMTAQYEPVGEVGSEAVVGTAENQSQTVSAHRC